MFSPIRKRLTYANVVATLALVFAMSGGALAASKYLITSSQTDQAERACFVEGEGGGQWCSGGRGGAGGSRSGWSRWGQRRKRRRWRERHRRDQRRERDEHSAGCRQRTLQRRRQRIRLGQWSQLCL